jgi:hypothetical protein
MEPAGMFGKTAKPQLNVERGAAQDRRVSGKEAAMTSNTCHA